MKLSGYILGLPKMMHVIFFGNRERRFFLTPLKGVFGYFGTPPSVFELECSNFQNVSYLPWLKFCRKQNFDLGPPKKARGGPKMVKILNFFVIQARTFKT